MSNRIGRNQQCPCGSGLKFKQCCLIKRREHIQQPQAIRKAANEFAKKSKEKKKKEKTVPVSIAKSESTEKTSD